MDSLKNPTRSSVVPGGKKPYDVTVSTNRLDNKSDDEIMKPDDSSDDVWPLQGIKKTVDVTIS